MVRTFIFLLLVTAAPALGQLQEYWGTRFGTTLVVQDNYEAYTDEKAARFGWLLAVSRTLPLTDWRSIKLVLEGQVRHSAMSRYVLGPHATVYNDSHVKVHEFVFTPLIIHSVPVNQARFFLQAGPEVAWVSTVSGTYYYDTTQWRRVIFSVNLGGGIIIPVARDKELVLDLRYNSDITEAVDGSGRNAPVGTRFDELHILLGVNLSLDDEGY